MLHPELSGGPVTLPPSGASRRRSGWLSGLHQEPLDSIGTDSAEADPSGDQGMPTYWRPEEPAKVPTPLGSHFPLPAISSNPLGFKFNLVDVG